MTKKKVTAENYRSDPLFQAVVRAVVGILEEEKVVRPIDVMQRIGWLKAEDLREWRFGRVPYLERVIRCNLPKLARFLRVLALYCEEIRLEPSHTAYVRHGKGPRTPLRFSKSGDANVEAAYSRHFVWKAEGPFAFPPSKRATARPDDPDTATTGTVGAS